MAPRAKGYRNFALRAAFALACVAAFSLSGAAERAPWAALALDALCAAFVVWRVLSARTSAVYLTLWGPLAWLAPKTTAAAVFLFGGRKHGALADAKREVNRTARSLGGDPEAEGNRLRLLGDRDGSATLHELRAQILGAKRRIHVSTYILAEDRVGKEIVALLARRAREGVTVRLLVDAVGSWGAPLTLCRPLRRAGGQVARFNPVLPFQGKGSANWRNHRKIAVFDGCRAVIGGQNLGLDYMGDEPSRRRFRDCSFLLEGPAAGALEQVFVADWCQATDEPPSAHEALLRERPDKAGPVRAEIVASGPDCRDDPLWDTYVRLVSGARSSITVVTPYFVPDRMLFSLLIAAAQAGRHVRLIVPRRSDHRLVDFARRWHLRTFREAGGEVLFYGPGVLHAKLTVVDGEAAVVGSANLDMRSLFLNYEVAAVIRDAAAVAAVTEYCEGLAAQCGGYSEDLYRRSRSRVGRAIEAVSRVLAPLL
ncbi:MAG: phospholipase D-like domain-containing protein [Opitutia bacterium]